MVQDNLKLHHRFVCLSDVDVPCERIFLKHGWPGWWSKVELFSEVVLGHLAPQRVAVDAEQFGCVSLVIVGLLKGFLDGLAFDIFKVQVADHGLERSDF